MLKREICSTLAVRNCLGSTQCFIRVDEGSLKRVHWTHDYLCGETSFSAPQYTPLPFPAVFREDDRRRTNIRLR